MDGGSGSRRHQRLVGVRGRWTPPRAMPRRPGTRQPPWAPPRPPPPPASPSRTWRGPETSQGGGRRPSPVGGERPARRDHHVYLAWVVANPDRGHRRCGDTGGAIRQVDQLEVAAAERGLDLWARIVGLPARVAVAEGRPAEATSGFEEAIALLGPDDLMRRSGAAASRLRSPPSGPRKPSSSLRSASSRLRASVPVRRRAVPAAGRGRSGGVRHPGRIVGVGRVRSALALTDREHDVATLVAKGRSTRRRQPSST